MLYFEFETVYSSFITSRPGRETPCLGVCDKARLKLVCSATETS